MVCELDGPYADSLKISHVPIVSQLDPFNNLSSADFFWTSYQLTSEQIMFFGIRERMPNSPTRFPLFSLHLAIFFSKAFYPTAAWLGG